MTGDTRFLWLVSFLALAERSPDHVKIKTANQDVPRD